MSLRLHLFGNFSLTLDDTPLATARWTYRKSHQLLKLLALQPGLQIHKDQVIELFWPDTPVKLASANLYRTIHYLRRALEADLGRVARSRFIELRGGIIRLRAESDVWIDVREFDGLLAEARDAASPASLLEAAVALYRGPLLYDDLYEEWTQSPRTLYEERYVATLHTLVRIYRASGAAAALIEAARHLVQLDETDEVTSRELIRAYARLGRRGEALRQYDRLARALATEFGSTPSAETIALYEQIRSGEGIAKNSLSAQPAALPPSNLRAPITPLIGRAAEHAAIAGTLASPSVRLLTLTGVAGVGKTSLALDVARALRPRFAHGTFVVDLAPLSDPSVLLPAVVAAIGLEEQDGRSPAEALRSYLADRELLLVLDNAEHLVGAAEQIGALLAFAPGLTVLVTSRRVLHLTGEHIYAVQPLALPDHTQSAAELAGVPAVALFVARARAAQHTFALTDANAAAVAAICVRLDGLPLAIELAAARVRHMPPPTILAQLDRRLAVLSGGPRDAAERHSSLRSALAWSFQQLTPAARRVFARAGVFAGGFTLRLAQAVALDDSAAAADDASAALLHTLGELVDSQLVQLDPAAAEQPRYQMLDTLREYALEQLEQLGETELLRDRHAAALVALVAELKPRLRGSPGAMDELDREAENIRAALRRMAERGPAERGLALANDLGPYWYIRSRSREGEGWLALMLDADARAGGVAPARLRASALNNAATFAARQGRRAAAAARYAESLALSREVGDRVFSARLLNNMGLLALYDEDDAQAEALLGEALAAHRELDLPRDHAVVQSNLGLLYERRGDYARARAAYESALALSRPDGDPYTVAVQLGNLAGVLILQGDLSAAAPAALEALRLYEDARSPSGIATMLGMVAIASGRRDAAAVRVLGAAGVLSESFGEIDTLPLGRERFQRYLDELRGELGGAFDPAWAEGRALSQQAAIAAARTLAA